MRCLEELVHFVRLLLQGYGDAVFCIDPFQSEANAGSQTERGSLHSAECQIVSLNLLCLRA